MIYGYARVSTPTQKFTTQTQALKEYGCQKIYREKVSGRSLMRPQFQELLRTLKPGDALVVTKLDRFARSTRNALEIIEQFREDDVSLIVLNWGGQKVDITTPTGKLMVTQLAAVAEFEADMIRERQLEGIALAKARGVYKGRPPQLTKNNVRVREALKEFAIGVRSVREISELYDISRASLYRIAKAEGIKRGEENTAELGQKRGG